MFSDGRLIEVIRDTLMQKRVIKWGYARLFGGPHPAACDSVAAHSATVSALSTIIAHECADRLEREAGIRLNLADVSLLAIFHDLGECRSGDTGAAGHATHGTCDLHSLEREGLQAVTTGLKLQGKVLALFDDYRAYRTPEAILVHIADNIEGYEKGLEVCRGYGEPADMALAILRKNLDLYEVKAEMFPEMSLAIRLLVREVLLPGVAGLRKAYGLTEIDFAQRRKPKRAIA